MRASLKFQSSFSQFSYIEVEWFVCLYSRLKSHLLLRPLIDIYNIKVPHQLDTKSTKFPASHKCVIFQVQFVGYSEAQLLSECQVAFAILLVPVVRRYLFYPYTLFHKCLNKFLWKNYFRKCFNQNFEREGNQISELSLIFLVKNNFLWVSSLFWYYNIDFSSSNFMVCSKPKHDENFKQFLNEILY